VRLVIRANRVQIFYTSPDGFEPEPHLTNLSRIALHGICTTPVVLPNPREEAKDLEIIRFIPNLGLLEYLTRIMLS